MRKIVFLISFFIISLFVNFRNVSADTPVNLKIGQPNSIIVTTGPGGGVSYNYSTHIDTSSLNGLSAWYVTPDLVNAGQSYVTSVYFMYQSSRLDWCGHYGRNNTVFSGYIVAYQDYINLSGIRVYFESPSGNYNQCSTIVNSKNKVGFVCSGLTYGGNIVVQNMSTIGEKPTSIYSIGIAQQMTVTCNADASTIINAQNQLKQDIINNQNQNKNDIINNQNQNQAQTNQKLDELQKEQEETNDFLTDDTPPNADISGLGNVSGLLPAGPLDSLLNIPFQFLSILTSSMSGTCVPLTGDFVWDSKITLPCFDEIIYGKINSTLMNFISLIPASFILIKYFKHLYKKVERAVSLESTSDDEWGCI